MLEKVQFNEVSMSGRIKKSTRVHVRDITKLHGYPRSNVKTKLEQSNLFLASRRFPLQNAIYDNKLPFHGGREGCIYGARDYL